MTSRPQAAPIPVRIHFDRVLVGAVAALIVARPLVSGDDPGRLRLTTGGGSVSFNLCVLLILIAACALRVMATKHRPSGWPLLPFLLLVVGVITFTSARLGGDRYVRPGLFIAWEWIALAAIVYLVRRVTASAVDSRGLLNVVLATAVSIAGLGLYQSLTDPLGLPSFDVTVPGQPAGLAGDDEFYPELNRPPDSNKTPRGTFDSPATLLVFLTLCLPLAVVVGHAAWHTPRRRWTIAVPIAILLGIIAAASAFPFRNSPQHISVALDLVETNCLLGVGPGNFTRMAPNATAANSAWFELAATIGVVGISLFAAAVIVAIARAWPPRVSTSTEPLPSGRQWEFHLGGAAGLVLGFVWAYGEVPAEAPAAEVFKLGTVAVLRAILWFAAFALIENVRPTPRTLRLAIISGVAVVLVAGLFSDAPGRPTILLPMFVLLAIAAKLRAPVAAIPDSRWARPTRVVETLLIIFLATAFLVTACLPAWATASGVRQARMASRHFPERDREIDRARTGPARINALTNARGYLLANIIAPLRDATERDLGNAALWLEIARWRRPLWRYQLVADPEDAARVADETRKAAEQAGKLDPHNLAAKRNLFEAMLLYRRESKTREPERIAALNKLIGQIADKEPTSEVPLRYRVVSMLLDRGDAEGVEAEIGALLRLNRVAGSPHGHLAADQKLDLVNRAMKLVKKPPPELLEEWVL